MHFICFINLILLYPASCACLTEKVSLPVEQLMMVYDFLQRIMKDWYLAILSFFLFYLFIFMGRMQHSCFSYPLILAVQILLMTVVDMLYNLCLPDKFLFKNCKLASTHKLGYLDWYWLSRLKSLRLQKQKLRMLTLMFVSCCALPLLPSFSFC